MSLSKDKRTAKAGNYKCPIGVLLACSGGGALCCALGANLHGIKSTL